MIPFLDLTRQHRILQRELMDAVERVLASSRFVLGPEGEALETELAALARVRHGIGLGSGTDALRLALTAVGVGPGDEVITPAFSFVASASTIVMAGAQPVFVDIDPVTYALDPDALESALTRRTRAIVVVHLYGHPAPIDRIAEVARRRGVPLVEDAAQAIGATWDDRPIGGWGDVACLSFYPTKNLGACGDAGLLLTGRDDVAEHVRRLRHHGDTGRYHHVELGYCSRLDEIQAAMLRVKLRHLEAWNVARRQLAARYRKLLVGLPLGLPYEHPRAQPIYHQFVVRHPRRDAFAKALADLGVGTMVHYPLPVPGQPLFGLDGEKRWPHSWRAAKEVLSLPCYPEMTDEEVEGVAAAVRTALERV
ncbi:MAG: DegT/DnrJ/EryC1/StrS family aminotransferase [Candidatus Rokuibacteriota bacterium]|jgi:dTDP-4-amino-4,6-dideoxygalactose transaminase|nr:DegT/DnrJ/EryC1/StrS family aminotransferase [Patescibacteria group bacterium]